MWWLSSWLLFSFIGGALCSIYQYGEAQLCNFADSPEFKEKVREIDTLEGNVYPFETIKTLLTSWEAQCCAMSLCLLEKRFRALKLILHFRLDDCPFPSGRLRMIVLSKVLSLHDKDVWDFFFLTNRMRQVILPCGCFEVDVDDSASFVGSFSFSDIAFVMWSNVFRYPAGFAFSTMVLLKSYVQEKADFMDFALNTILEGEFEMRVFFDFFALMNEVSSQQVSVYPKLLHMISRFDAKQVDESVRTRLERPFYEYFATFDGETAYFKNIFGIDFASIVFVKAARVHYNNNIGSFIKSLIFTLINDRGGTRVIGSVGDSLTRIVDPIIALHPFSDCPLLLEDFLLELFDDLLLSACGAVNAPNLDTLDSISQVVFAVMQRIPTVRIPESCKIDGRLRGVALYILAQIPCKFNSIVEPATFAEVFAIPMLASRSFLFHPLAISSSLGRLIDPIEALKYILSCETPDLLAIRNIYLIFTAETGDFRMVSTVDPSRKVEVNLESYGQLQAIVVRITKERDIFEQVTQILGFVGIDNF